LHGAESGEPALRSGQKIYDPFLIASCGDESYYIEVWDEPEFERKHT
jgi:hypothetical protein